MLAIKDNFLKKHLCETIYKDSLENKENIKNISIFVDRKLEECLKSEDFADQCIIYASKYFDLSSMVGYEVRYSFSGFDRWHLEKDEFLANTQSIFEYPICQILYYGYAETHLDSRLLFKDFEVSHAEIKTNRIVCFNSRIQYQDEISGSEKFLITIHPWSYKKQNFDASITTQLNQQPIENSESEKRQCGGCTMCCQGWLTGQAYGKSFYPGKPCHFVGSNGCSIYNKRPHDPCVQFRCGWLDDKETFPEWLKPNMSNLIAVKSKTKRGVPYYKLYECGVKIDSSALNYLILHCLSGACNMSIQVGGGWSNFGSQEFLNDVNN